MATAGQLPLRVCSLRSSSCVSLEVFKSSPSASAKPKVQPVRMVDDRSSSMVESEQS